MSSAAAVHTYLDTSSLMRRADGLATTVSNRNQKIAAVLDGVFADGDRVFACSELTLLEFHDNITTALRSQDRPECDEDWWLRAREMLFRCIAEGQVEVLPTPPKSAEHVMSLITFATRQHNRKLKAADAEHVVVAARWAYELSHPVEFLTSDSDFDTVFLVQEFTGRLTVVNLDELAGTGEGADRKND